MSPKPINKYLENYFGFGSEEDIALIPTLIIVLSKFDCIEHLQLRNCLCRYNQETQALKWGACQVFKNC